jgi:hypothetical protein
MNIMKIRKACQPIRMALGVALVGAGIYTGNPWFYLGVIPFIAGATNFCPLCMITKKCEI